MHYEKGCYFKRRTTTGGGIVVQCSGYEIGGLNIALVGDSVICSHGTGVIIEGDENFLINGRPVALNGHKASCGCTLVSQKLAQENFIEKITSNVEEESFGDKVLDFFNICENAIAEEESYKEKTELLSDVLDLDPVKDKYKLQALSRIGEYRANANGKNLIHALSSRYCLSRQEKKLAAQSQFNGGSHS
ncbi:PAAR domain-containing protein [Fluviispira vulneris]|uniref:PAAR domain-containing protein n=1 Tax=Fluviispira vulneris TaxID=2763012 RepID=UPI0016483C48|nr:PAAR domain-containing protein [Fluviispira vulneris]